MKRIAYFDCFAGVSGDMILGALVGAGLKLSDLNRLVAGLGLKGCVLRARKVTRCGLSGTRVEIETGKGAGKRIAGPSAMKGIIERGRVPEEVKSTAIEALNILARAEASAHGKNVRGAHFHELGAVDTIIDIVGAVGGLYKLSIRDCYSSPLPWNGGFVKTIHGNLPSPAPATSYIMKGLDVYHHPVREELVTPTGAAILKACVKRFGGFPAIRITGLGYGAGDRNLKNYPNLLRMVIGESDEFEKAENVMVVETEIDDMPPSHISHLQAKLLSSGARDAFITPVVMKKGRTGHLLTVICGPEDLRSVADMLFNETTTLGLRFREQRRFTLNRKTVRLATPYGMVRVKVARRPDGSAVFSPEYEDCTMLASRHRVKLEKIIAAARKAAARIKSLNM